MARYELFQEVDAVQFRDGMEHPGLVPDADGRQCMQWDYGTRLKPVKDGEWLVTDSLGGVRVISEEGFRKVARRLSPPTVTSSIRRLGAAFEAIGLEVPAAIVLSSQQQLDALRAALENTYIYQHPARPDDPSAICGIRIEARDGVAAAANQMTARFGPDSYGQNAVVPQAADASQNAINEYSR